MKHNIQYWKYKSEDFLEEFKNYNNVMEKFLVQQYLNRKKTSIPNSEIKNLDSNDLLKFSKEFYEQETFYPQSFRTSFFTQIFSVFEYELKKICSIHHLENKTDFSVTDLKGNGEIEKAKLYLQKACKINFEALEPEWTYLDTIRKIRNIIIHHQGEIRQNHGDWSTIYKFIEFKKNQIGFGNSAEYLDKEKFKELFDKDSVFNIEISDSDINEELITSIKTLLKKIVLQLDLPE
jgi:hypothetical protein